MVLAGFEDVLERVQIAGELAVKGASDHPGLPGLYPLWEMDGGFQGKGEAAVFDRFS